MKFPPTLFAGLFLSLGLAHAQSESSFEQDLATLLDQREKALTAASAPIQDKFHRALENLLNLALKSKDEQAAHKIRRVISVNERLRSGDRLDLRYPLRGSVWTVSPDSPVRPGLSERITFQDVTVEPMNQKYVLTKENEVILIFNRGDTQLMKLDAFGTRLEFQFQGKTYTYEAAPAR